MVKDVKTLNILETYEELKSMPDKNDAQLHVLIQIRDLLDVNKIWRK